MFKVRVKYMALVFVFYVVSLVTIYKFVTVLQGKTDQQTVLLFSEQDGTNEYTVDAFKLNWNRDANAYFKRVKKTPQNMYLDDQYSGECSKDSRLGFREIADDLYVYSAYLDKRTSPPFVRMFGAMKKWAHDKFDKQLWCHFDADLSLKNRSFVPTEVTLYQTCENHNKKYSAYIFNCPLPPKITLVPVSFRFGYGVTSDKSLIQSKLLCLKSRDSRVEIRKLRFGVCVPPLFGTVKAKQLLEFIEFNRILGADRFVFYVEESGQSISNDVRKIIQYYENLNIAILIPWKLPFETDGIWYHGQSIAINDCLYKYMYDFEHLLFVDLDEYLVPHGEICTWKDLLREMHGKYGEEFLKSSGFAFRPAYFDPTRSRPIFSNEMDTCVIVNRTRNYSNRRLKVMVRPERVYELGIHHVSRPWPLESGVAVLKVEPALAYIHHYRECAFEFGIQCPVMILDDTVPNKYGKRLLENYLRSKYDIQP